MPHYDLAIIGSGSGNSLITPFWDGRKVALIDGGVFGGTCLNVGCIPTKMFVYPATLAAVPGDAARLGVDLSLDKVRWNELRDRIFGRIDAISESGRRYRAEELENVDLVQEHARFTGPRTLTTDSGRLPLIPGRSSPRTAWWWPRVPGQCSPTCRGSACRRCTPRTP
nr:hypothetical protein [Pseudarthrobacter humi]